MPWLHRAHTDVVDVESTSIVLRTATGSAAVVTALNLGATPEELPAADGRFVAAGSGTLHAGRVMLAPAEWVVLSS